MGSREVFDGSSVSVGVSDAGSNNGFAPGSKGVLEVGPKDVLDVASVGGSAVVSTVVSGTDPADSFAGVPVGMLSMTTGSIVSCCPTAVPSWLLTNQSAPFESYS